MLFIVPVGVRNAVAYVYKVPLQSLHRYVKLAGYLLYIKIIEPLDLDQRIPTLSNSVQLFNVLAPAGNNSTQYHSAMG